MKNRQRSAEQHSLTMEPKQQQIYKELYNKIIEKSDSEEEKKRFRSYLITSLYNHIFYRQLQQQSEHLKSSNIYYCIDISTIYKPELYLIMINAPNYKNDLQH